jgi:hypothetical protein
MVADAGADVETMGLRQIQAELRGYSPLYVVRSDHDRGASGMEAGALAEAR